MSFYIARKVFWLALIGFAQAKGILPGDTTLSELSLLAMAEEELRLGKAVIKLIAKAFLTPREDQRN